MAAGATPARARTPPPLPPSNTVALSTAACAHGRIRYYAFRLRSEADRDRWVHAVAAGTSRGVVGVSSSFLRRYLDQRRAFFDRRPSGEKRLMHGETASDDHGDGTQGRAGGSIRPRVSTSAVVGASQSMQQMWTIVRHDGPNQHG